MNQRMRKQPCRSAIMLLVVVVGAWSCGSDDNPVKTEDDIPRTAVIYADERLAAVDTLTTATGLQYIQLEGGSGRPPGRGSLVSVHYTGMLDDGTVFDSSYPRGVPFSFALGQGVVIKGWDEGIGLMLAGARGRLIIPPHLGYGERGAGNLIPPDATILFDVWLVGID